MVDVLVAVMPFAGHVAPFAAVVEAFVARGHTVRVYTGAAHAERFRALGAQIVPWRAAPDFDENDLAATFPTLRGRKGARQVLTNVEVVFIGTAAAQCADLARAYADRPWDVIVADGLSLGTRLISELTPAPWVTVGIVPLSFLSRELPPPILGIAPARGPIGRARDAVLRGMTHLFTRGMQRAYERQRGLAGSPPGEHRIEDAWASPTLFCASGVPELEYPAHDRPQQVVFVGALTPSASVAAKPGWWGDVTDATAPIVHVTQGTLNVDPDDLLRPTIAALGRQHVLLLATTGRRGVTELPFPVAGNTRVSDLLPYPELLPAVDVMITNGGWGGVLAALSHGIPLVVAGGDLDKPAIAGRVQWAGAGVNLRTGRPRPRAILDAWRQVSTDPRYREAAERIGASLREHDGPAEVVEHTLALLAAHEGRTGATDPVTDVMPDG